MPSRRVLLRFRRRRRRHRADQRQVEWEEALRIVPGAEVVGLPTRLSPCAEPTYAAAIPLSDDAVRRRCASFLAISHSEVGQGLIIRNYVTLRDRGIQSYFIVAWPRGARSGCHAKLHAFQELQ